MRISDWSSDVCSSDLLVSAGCDGSVGAELVVAGLAAAADIAEGLLDRGFVAFRCDLGELVGGGGEVATDAPSFVEILEELRLQASRLAQLFGGGVRAVQAAHAGVCDGGDGIGSGSYLGLVVGLLAIDYLGLDLAHVPGRELVACLAGFDHLFRLHLRLDGSAGQQGGGHGACHQCFHGNSLSILGYRRPRPLARNYTPASSRVWVTSRDRRCDVSGWSMARQRHAS